MDNGRKVCLLLLLLFICFASPLKAGSDYEMLFRQSGRIPASYFSTSDRNLGVHSLLSAESSFVFSQLPARHRLSPRKHYWLKLDFSSIDLSASQEWVKRFTLYDEISIFYQNGDSIASHLTGKMRRPSLEGPPAAIDFYFGPENLIEGRYLLVRIHHIFRKKHLIAPSYFHPFIIELDNRYYSADDIRYFLPYLLFLGGMLLMIMYSFGIFFMNRDTLFNYYAVYLLTLVLYLGIRLPLIYDPLQQHFPLFMTLYNDLIQVVVNIAYLLFAAAFLNARTEFPYLYRAIRYAIVLLAGIMVLQVGFGLSVRYAYVEAYLIQFERYFMIVFALAAYVHILMKYKTRMVFFLLVGSFFFLVGGIAAMFLNDIKYMMMGTALEVFIFSLGMGYRIKLSEKEKQSIEIEMNKMRLTALRAQMNPHFIFNSLNAIRAYVIAHNTRKASDYLGKFSFLIRHILQYSAKDSISLNEEIETLSLYVQLEQLRFREEFNFEVISPPGFRASHYRVPPLILQPYVENAIIHGLAAKKGEKKLEIRIEVGNTHLYISIKDNGLGRSQTREKTDYHGLKHESMAMELTNKRIDLSARQKSENKNILITDLKENGSPAGTEVCIKLPVQVN